MWELFFCVALSSQINIELFFHVIRNYLRNWAALCACHMFGERDILLQMIFLHNGHRVVAVMNCCGIGRSKAGKGNRRNTVIRKRSGVAGVNALLCFHTEASLRSQVLDVVNQLFLRRAAGNEASHDAADHIKVDIENSLFQISLMSSRVCFGAEQAALLAAAPDKTKGIAMRMLRKIARGF